jgi:hypothetical protein
MKVYMMCLPLALFLIFMNFDQAHSYKYDPNISLSNFTNQTFSVGLSVAYTRYFAFKNFFFLSKWTLIENNGPYFLCLVVIFLMAFVIEAMNYLRFNMQAKLLVEFNPLIKYDEDSMNIPGRKKLLLTLIYCFSTILSYLLLLLAF